VLKGRKMGGRIKAHVFAPERDWGKGKSPSTNAMRISIEGERAGEFRRRKMKPRTGKQGYLARAELNTESERKGFGRGSSTAKGLASRGKHLDVESMSGCLGHEPTGEK